MTGPAHHVPDAMLAAYAADALGYPFAMLVAAHVSFCDECRARLEAHHAVGGLVLEALPPEAVAADCRASVLEAAAARPDAPQATDAGNGIYPCPVARLIGGDGPRWQSLGFGARQSILWSGAEGSLRLLSIPAGQAVPEHGHRGLELTLVLSGAFADSQGIYRAGDLEVADEDLDHIPVATDEAPCVCIAATDAPLRFHGFIPRLLQPLLRI